MKKERERHGLFVVDGVKSVKEALASDYSLEKIIIAKDLEAAERSEIESKAAVRKIPVIQVNFSEIEQISSLKSPEGVLAIAKISSVRNNPDIQITYPALYLWQINDPGNLGTIMRTALWFGIGTILISPGSVDIYSPKVVRSAMGALFRLTLVTEVNFEWIEELIERDRATLWAADMSGVTAKPTIDDDLFILAFGSESHGLPQDILQRSARVIGIENYGYGESLNLAVSVGIILNIIRQK